MDSLLENLVGGGGGRGVLVGGGMRYKTIQARDN